MRRAHDRQDTLRHCWDTAQAISCCISRHTLVVIVTGAKSAAPPRAVAPLLVTPLPSSLPPCPPLHPGPGVGRPREPTPLRLPWWMGGRVRCRVPPMGLPAYRVSPMVYQEKAANVLCPHALFSNIYHHYPEIWRTRIMESEAVLEEFWEAMEGHPLLDHVKLRERSDGYRQTCVPLRIHGDDTPVTGIGKGWTKVCFFLSWRQSTDGFNNMIKGCHSY